MGKSKKGFNWKARQVVKTDIDESSAKKISVELDKLKPGNYDECNALVLPSEKRATKKDKKKETITRILSKKQRKRLEKVLDQKKKKQNRASLLEALSQVKASPEVLDKMTSLASIQTKGLKRHFSELHSKTFSMLNETVYDGESVVNSVKGSKKRRMLLAMANVPSEERKLDPNVVGLEESESESEIENENLEESSLDSENQTTVENSVTLNTFIKESVNEKECQKMETCVSEENDDSVKQQLQKSFNDEIKLKVSVKELVPSDPAVFVPVARQKHMQESRLKLPILGEEQVIMEAIKENPVVILAGETGSGKTTQVPQFLYEGGYGLNGKLIGVTEPRRVAAISMSRRVAEEMNLTKEVSYLIRFEGNVTEDTKIKFMTDGVLLREIQNDFLLTQYSVIIIDEAHERSVFTDILLGLLSRIVPLRERRGNPLKLIVMSATLRIEDFTDNPRLFRTTPPVIKVESRQYPVSIHFNRRTAPNYVREAYLKTCKIHAQLPEGGVLVFLTGQQEVNTLVRKLRATFPFKNKKNQFLSNKDLDNESIPRRRKLTGKTLDSDEDEEVEMDMQMAIQNARRSRKKQKDSASATLPDIDLNDYCVLPSDDTEGDLLAQEEEGTLDSDDEFGDVEDLVGSTSQPMWVLPLYSLLSTEKQVKVFKPPPEGCRLVVVATNVAETSLTIPNIKYVVDCGKIKAKLYDAVTGVSAFQVVWTSKASANQRAGRAGRIGPGHCYRLYSSAVYNDEFPEFSIPEIQRRPVDDLMLQMKVMGIHKVVNFPFPSAPDLLQLRASERRLVILGALEIPKINPDRFVSNMKMNNLEEEYASEVTQLGHIIAAFPVAPRFGKMLALSHQHEGLLPLTICLVAALSVQEVFHVPQNIAVTEEKQNDQQTEKNQHPTQEQSKPSAGGLGSWCRRRWGGLGCGPHSVLLGDAGALIRAVGASEYAGSSENFCSKAGLRHRAIIEIRKLRVQLSNEIALHVPNVEAPSVDPKMSPPSDTQAKLLRQIILAGMVDHVAHRVSPDEIKEDKDKEKWKNAYRCAEMEDPVFLHSSSVLRKELPEWVVFQEVFETTKLYIRGITAVEPEWLPTFAPSLCNLSEPLEDPPPRFDVETERLLCHVSGTFGRAGWTLPVMEVDFPVGLDRYRWFAVFLLEGDVFPVLKSYRKSLVSMPNLMVKSWAKIQPRTDILLKALMALQVDSKAKLRQAWEKDPTYLFPAYLRWLPESAHNEVSLLWPPL